MMQVFKQFRFLWNHAPRLIFRIRKNTVRTLKLVIFYKLKHQMLIKRFVTKKSNNVNKFFLKIVLILR